MQERRDYTWIRQIVHGYLSVHLRPIAIGQIARISWKLSLAKFIIWISPNHPDSWALYVANFSRKHVLSLDRIIGFPNKRVRPAVMAVAVTLFILGCVHTDHVGEMCVCCVTRRPCPVYLSFAASRTSGICSSAAAAAAAAAAAVAAASTVSLLSLSADRRCPKQMATEITWMVKFCDVSVMPKFVKFDEINTSKNYFYWLKLCVKIVNSPT